MNIIVIVITVAIGLFCFYKIIHSYQTCKRYKKRSMGAVSADVADLSAIEDAEVREAAVTLMCKLHSDMELKRVFAFVDTVSANRSPIGAETLRYGIALGYANPDREEIIKQISLVFEYESIDGIPLSKMMENGTVRRKKLLTIQSMFRRMKMSEPILAKAEIEPFYIDYGAVPFIEEIKY